MLLLSSFGSQCHHWPVRKDKAPRSRRSLQLRFLEPAVAELVACGNDPKRNVCRYSGHCTLLATHPHHKLIHNTTQQHSITTHVHTVFIIVRTLQR